MPGRGEAIGIDRGVTITAALSDGRKLHCPQLTAKERAQIRKHQRRAARAKKGMVAVHNVAAGQGGFPCSRRSAG